MSGPRLGRPVGPQPVVQVLADQGDARLQRDPRSGRNRYGCLPFPAEVRPCFGSATASSISPASFDAVAKLHARVAMAPPSVQAAECDRLRHELAGFCGVDNLPGTALIFAASGTDLHLIAAQLCGRTAQGKDRPPLAVVLSDTPETGNGVPAALTGRYYNSRAPFQAEVPEGGELGGCRAVETHAVAGRRSDGHARPAAEVDAETGSLLERAVSAGQDVLLIVSDQSKTGLLMPTPARVLEWKQRFGARLEVFVDACQLRLCPETVRAYVEHGFLVGLTGSKFATGPAFSGALLVPPALAEAWSQRPLPPSLAAYSARADWPKGWAGRDSMKQAVNLGLLYRWQAALTEMGAFHSLPRAAVAGLFRAFSTAVRGRLDQDPSFEALDAGPLDRSGIVPGTDWDAEATLFPFLPLKDGRPLDHGACRDLYWSVLQTHGEIGQPAHCGTRQGRVLGALRLCASMRTASEALKPGGRGADALIADALGLLDKIAGQIKGQKAGELDRRPAAVGRQD